jgi:hypothetical protein
MSLFIKYLSLRFYKLLEGFFLRVFTFYNIDLIYSGFCKRILLMINLNPIIRKIFGVSRYKSREIPISTLYKYNE